jgi:hypothetical protein
MPVGESSTMARYYSIAEANDRLAALRPVLEGLRSDRDKVADMQRELVAFRRTNGNAGHVQDVARREEAIAQVVQGMETAVRQIEGWGITLRDIGSGLVDFPALASGRPIWLCWRLGESDVAWWHELTTGMAGRKPLIEMT